MDKIETHLYEVNPHGMYIIKILVEGEVYKFLLLTDGLVGEILCLVENEREYVLLHEEKAMKTGILISEQLKKELFEGWLWIYVNEFGLYRRKVTELELETYKFIKQNISIDIGNRKN
ncbi:hypothetical protein JDS87_11955 [Bacillus cereus]|uniref:hypothetical protein n=1 Tax=Bacillus cereus TaxID=1396 RepID=UPI0018F40A12|nr:hypothetical protein [Bacillus cereus]MBJ8052686.1 hypothetical protein [Bacillus cereus]